MPPLNNFHAFFLEKKSNFVTLKKMNTWIFKEIRKEITVKVKASEAFSQFGSVQ